MNTVNPHIASVNEYKTLRSEIDTLTRRIRKLEHENRLLQKKSTDSEQQRQTGDKEIKGAQALQLAELIIDNSPAILFRRLAADDLKSRKMVYVSPNISRFGYSAEDFLDNRIMFRDILHPDDKDRIGKEIKHFVDENIENYSQFYRIVTKKGDVRWVEDRTSVVEDPLTAVRYHQGIVIDIHKRKMAEEALRKSEEKYRRIVETAGEGYLLLDASLTIVDLNSAYARMVGRSRQELLGTQPFAEDSEAFRQFWDDKTTNAAPKQYHEFECNILNAELRLVPVLIHATTLRSDSDEIIGNMAFVTDMTVQKKALSLAGEVQRSLLPTKAPLVNGFDIAGKSVPCDEVGGDYFDYLWSGENENSPLTVVVGDISGHGVDSALLMSSARAFLRMRASQPGTTTDIVVDLNNHLTDDVLTSGRFMTLFYLTIEKEKQTMTWIRAGHDPALLYDPESDRFEELKGPGVALGVRRNFPYQLQKREGLEKNQLIILGTDGIWEGRNCDDEMFGKKRLKTLLRRHASDSAETILEAVFTAQAEFTQGMIREDDLTLVIIKLL